MRLVWGPYPLSVSALYEALGSLHFGEEIYPTYNLVVIVIGVAAAAGIWAFVYRTHFGVVLRATSQNMRMASALGVNVNRVYVQAFSLGCFMAGLGGAVVVPQQGAVLGMGVDALILAFVVVVIGGLGSLEGALVGRRPRRHRARDRHQPVSRDRAGRALPHGRRRAPHPPRRAVRPRMNAAASPRRVLSWAVPVASRSRSCPSSCRRTRRCSCRTGWSSPSPPSASTCSSATRGSCPSGTPRTSGPGRTRWRSWSSTSRSTRWRCSSSPESSARPSWRRSSASCASATRGSSSASSRWRCPRCCGASRFKFFWVTGGSDGLRVPTPTLLGGTVKIGRHRGPGQARLPVAPVLLLRARHLRARHRPHVGDRPLAVRQGAAGRPRQRDAGGVRRRAGLALPLGGLRHLGRLHGAGGGALGAAQRPHHARHPALDLLREDRLLHRARGLPDVLRPHRRRRCSSTTSRRTPSATRCTGRWCSGSCSWCSSWPCPRASWARRSASSPASGGRRRREHA